jgi:hypothetical protein
MTSRKKYSLPYRIYRRLRYLRHVVKSRAARRRMEAKAEKEEKLARKKTIRKKRLSDIQAERIKNKLEKAEERILEKERRYRLKEEAGASAQEAQIIREEKRRLQKFRKHRRMRLFRFFMKACAKNTLRFIRGLNPLHFPRLLKHAVENRDNISKFVIIALHSTLLFVAAYLLIFFAGLITSVIAGLFFNFHSILYFHEVVWLVKPEQWYGDSVKTIFSSGPVISGILGVIMAILFAQLRTGRGLFKLFFLWGALHGFNAFFGSLLTGSIFGKGLGHALEWSYFSDTEKVIFSIISILALVLIGVFSARSFLISANSYYPHLEKRMQTRFLWAQLITPFLAGSLLVGAVMFPEILLYDMTVMYIMFITILTIIITARFYPTLYFEDEHIKIALRARLIIPSILFILLYRLVLGIGIPFG